MKMNKVETLFKHIQETYTNEELEKLYFLLFTEVQERDNDSTNNK